MDFKTLFTKINIFRSYLFCWKGRETEKGKIQRNSIFHSVAHIPKLHQPGLGHAESRSFIQLSYMDARDPHAWAINCCLLTELRTEGASQSSILGPLPATQLPPVPPGQSSHAEAGTAVQ